MTTLSRFQHHEEYMQVAMKLVRCLLAVAVRLKPCHSLAFFSLTTDFFVCYPREFLEHTTESPVWSGHHCYFVQCDTQEIMMRALLSVCRLSRGVLCRANPLTIWFHFFCAAVVTGGKLANPYEKIIVFANEEITLHVFVLLAVCELPANCCPTTLDVDLLPEHYCMTAERLGTTGDEKLTCMAYPGSYTILAKISKLYDNCLCRQDLLLALTYPNYACEMLALIYQHIQICFCLSYSIVFVVLSTICMCSSLSRIPERANQWTTRQSCGASNKTFLEQTN